MILLKDFAAELGRDLTSVRRRALKYGVPLFKAVNPGSNQMVLVLTPTAAKQLRALYPSKVSVVEAVTAREAA